MVMVDNRSFIIDRGKPPTNNVVSGVIGSVALDAGTR
jgi:hypothetical protein